MSDRARWAEAKSAPRRAPLDLPNSDRNHQYLQFPQMTLRPPPQDTLFTFTPDRKLLQPLFNSYKLARTEDDIPASESTLIPTDARPRTELVSDPTRLSYAEVQARAKHNRLSAGRDGAFYYIDEGLRVIRITVGEVSLLLAYK